MNFIDYVHVAAKLLVLRTSPKLARTRVTNFVTSFWITLIITVTSHDPDKVIFNFVDVLNTTEVLLNLD